MIERKKRAKWRSRIGINTKKHRQILNDVIQLFLTWTDEFNINVFLGS